MSSFSFIRENARWLAGGFLLTLFSSFGQTFFIALSSGEIRREFGLSHGDFGWLYMAATIASAALIPSIGRMIDSARIERYAAAVVLGLAASMLLLAVSPNVVLLFFALLGLRLFGQGLMSHTAMTAIGRWFSVRRGKAVSTVALGHQFGESIAPISFVAVAALTGWRGGWMIYALLLVAAVLPAVYLLMRVPRQASAAEIGGRAEGRQWTRGEAVRDPAFWLLLCGILAPPVIGTIVFFHQVHLTEVRGWTLGRFAGSTPVLSVFAIGATVMTGFVIDRLGAINLVPVMLVCLAAGNLALGLVESPAAIVVYMACMGMTFGMYASIFGVIWPELYGTTHLGAIRSLVTSLMVLGTALGPGITGWMIDRGVALPAMITATGAYAALAVLLTAALARLLSARARSA